MSFLFGGVKAPTPPPPPNLASTLAAPTIMEQAAQERATLASAEGQGTMGTDMTGGQGAKNPSTTKSLLG